MGQIIKAVKSGSGRLEAQYDTDMGEGNYHLYRITPAEVVVNDVVEDVERIASFRTKGEAIAALDAEK